MALLPTGISKYSSRPVRVFSAANYMLRSVQFGLVHSLSPRTRVPVYLQSTLLCRLLLFVGPVALSEALASEAANGGFLFVRSDARAACGAAIHDACVLVCLLLYLSVVSGIEVECFMQ